MTDSKGGHAEGFEPTNLDAHQHGTAQNTIDEQKPNHGAQTSVDKTLPAAQSSSAPNLPEIRGGQTLSESVNEALKGSGGLATDKAQRIDESVKVGGDVGVEEEEDLHAKAAAKQP